MMDLLAIVPYYTAYLSRALLAEGIRLQVGSISYYLDPDCFKSRGIRNDPGLLDIVGRFRLSKGPRRVLKMPEAVLNMFALSARFFFSPPDILHVQFLPMLRWKFPLDLWFVAFCQKRGAKFVLTVHDILPHDTAETYKKTFTDLYRRADSLICHSESIRTRLMSEFDVAAGKISVIPHGPFFYDLPSRDKTGIQVGKEPSPQMVLWQGIILPYKGVDLLLNAWQKVEAEMEGAHLVVLGTGAPELLDQLRQQAQHLGLARVTFDFRFASAEEVVANYRAADVVVYPYRAITTSGALATGLALGKAIIANDLPVFREQLTDREDALLVNSEDANELSGAIIELLLNPALRDRLAQAVRRREFGPATWQKIAHRTAEVYDALLHP